MRGVGQGNSRGYRQEKNTGGAHYVTNPADFDGPTDAAPRIVAYGIVAICGGISGVLIAGSVTLGLAVYVALICGCIVGWFSRRFAEGGPR